MMFDEKHDDKDESKAYANFDPKNPLGKEDNDKDEIKTDAKFELENMLSDLASNLPGNLQGNIKDKNMVRLLKQTGEATGCAVRCMDEKYIDSFIHSGEIWFGMAIGWEESKEKGRGDEYEGTLAFANIDDEQRIKELKSKIPDYHTHKVDEDKRCLIKNNEDMYTPVLCMYGVEIKDFEFGEENGERVAWPAVNLSYIEEFAANNTQGEKKGMVLIKELGTFCDRLKAKLGPEVEQMFVDKVEYIDYSKACSADGSYELRDCSQPRELFIKSNDYSHQKEVRIILKMTDPDLQNKERYSIKIGDISDIAMRVEECRDAGPTVNFKQNDIKGVRFDKK